METSIPHKRKLWGISLDSSRDGSVEERLESHLHSAVWKKEQGVYQAMSERPRSGVVRGQTFVLPSCPEVPVSRGRRGQTFGFRQPTRSLPQVIER